MLAIRVERGFRRAACSKRFLPALKPAIHSRADCPWKPSCLRQSLGVRLAWQVSVSERFCRPTASVDVHEKSKCI